MAFLCSPNTRKSSEANRSFDLCACKQDSWDWTSYTGHSTVQCSERKTTWVTGYRLSQKIQLPFFLLWKDLCIYAPNKIPYRSSFSLQQKTCEIIIVCIIMKPKRKSRLTLSFHSQSIAQWKQMYWSWKYDCGACFLSSFNLLHRRTWK